LHPGEFVLFRAVLGCRIGFRRSSCRFFGSGGLRCMPEVPQFRFQILFLWTVRELTKSIFEGLNSTLELPASAPYFFRAQASGIKPLLCGGNQCSLRLQTVKNDLNSLGRDSGRFQILTQRSDFIDERLGKCRIRRLRECFRREEEEK